MEKFGRILSVAVQLHGRGFNISKRPWLCTLLINEFVSVNRLIQVHSLGRRLVKHSVCIFEEV